MSVSSTHFAMLLTTHDVAFHKKSCISLTLNFYLALVGVL